MSDEASDLERLVSLDSALEKLTLAEGVFRDHPIGPLTTCRVGGSATHFVRPVDHEELFAVAAAVESSELPVLMLGRGSNLLVADKGFTGVVIQLAGAFEKIRVTGTTVVAGGAASLPVVARSSVASGLTGFEWAVGVPGSIGGGVRMNAGGHGSDMATSLVEVAVMDLNNGSVSHRSVSALGLGYRTSLLRPDETVVSACLELQAGDRQKGEQRLTEIVRWRRENQPGGHNAGSVFVNPDGDSAGRLIEVAGCQGLRLGTAQVSKRHANFIQSDDDGSADDVAALMNEVKRRVSEVHGIDLKPEMVMVGFA